MKRTFALFFALVAFGGLVLTAGCDKPKSDDAGKDSTPAPAAAGKLGNPPH